jgi:uncharacterized membrane protein
MAGWRALLWAAAPPLALYAFQNWELLVVAAAVIGFWLWRRGQVMWAGLAVGIGARFKLYPILFLVPLVLERWAAADRQVAVRTAAVGIGTFALINLPFIVASPTGWFATYQFHSLREANYDSIWRLGVPHLSPDELNLVSTILTAGFVGIALVWGARRAGRYPFLQVCGAMLVGFLLGGKVHSPQYALWILPFFVLLDVRVVWWVAYTLADLTRYVGVTIRDSDPSELSDALLTTGVWARAALLLALFVIFLRAKPVGIRPAFQPAHPIFPPTGRFRLRRTG